MSVNFEQNDALHSYVKDTQRPWYQIQKLHFAMNNPVQLLTKNKKKLIFSGSNQNLFKQFYRLAMAGTVYKYSQSHASGTRTLWNRVSRKK